MPTKHRITADEDRRPRDSKRTQHAKSETLRRRQVRRLKGKSIR